ncbi:MAG: S-layer homology domain-containing protein [Clostridia bacterium]|nr:S-layer homology domain-containing protein [Clostridia bacterium]
MKKLLASLLTAIMLLSNMSIVSFAQKDKTAADFTRLSTITSIGLPASDVYTKSGSYTMELSGENIYKNIKAPCTENWTEYNTMEMWYYSPNKVKSAITIAIISDNKKTSGLDYYAATFYTGKMGWNLISIPYAGEKAMVEKVNSPKGFDSIDRIEIWTQYGGNVPAEGTELYFDKLTLTYKEPEEFAEIETENTESTGNKDELVLFENVLMTTAAVDFGTPPVSDFTSYNTLVLKLNSEVASGRTYQFVFQSENPATVTTDYFFTYLTVNWVGEKEWCLDIRDGGGMAKGQSALGWDKITRVLVWTGLTDLEKASGRFENEKTRVTVEKMYLTNRDYDTIFAPETGNYTMEALPKESFIDYTGQVEWTDYEALIKSRYSGENSHPRLLVTGEKLAKMKEWAKTDLYVNKSYANLIDSCNSIITKEHYKTPSSTEPGAFTSLALAYNLTGEQKYADWLWESLLNYTVKAQNWNPNNASYLSVGDTMRNVAYCYDLMYNHWTEEQRRIVRNGMMHFGIEPTMNYLRGNRQFTGANGGNWTQIVLSGIGAIAMSIAGDAPQYDGLCNEILNRMVEGLTMSHGKTIDPDGTYQEGPSYWGYGMGNYLPFLATMYNATGTTGGIMELPGMRRVGNYPIGMTGPKGTYNYSDGNSTSSITTGGYFFLSQYYDDATYGAYQMQYTGSTGGDILALALYEPDARYNDANKYMPKYTYYQGTGEVLTIRRSWTDNNAAFLGLKAGSNATGHGNLDIGSWLYDAMGVRWAHELGRDAYEAANNYEEGRWVFYRNRAEGQNALVINTDGSVDQNTRAHCVIDEFQVTDNAAYTVMDITEAYEGKGADSVKRGLAMLNNYGSLLIQDEIESAEPIEVYSFMHTKANIDVAPDGKSAILSQDGQKMRVKLYGDGKLLNMPADPLPSSPNPPEAWSRAGYRKLAVHVNKVKSPTLVMLLTPCVEQQEYEFSLDRVLPLSAWKTYTKNTVGVDEIYLEGIPIAGFDSTISSYILNEYEVGKITADAPAGVEVTIKQAEKLGDTAFVVAKSTKTGTTAVYTVSFANQLQSMMEVSSYTPKGFVASEKVDGAPRMVDGDADTDWSVSSANWVGFDLGEQKELREVKLIWFKGSERIAYFTIDVSDDGQTWRTVYTGESFMTPDFETYKFDTTKARYIRVNSSGNSVNNYVSICEMRVTAYEDSFKDISGHWAKGDIQNLANLGIITGVGDGMYNPDGTITRAQFVKLIQRVTGFSDMAYSGALTDVDKNSWYLGGVEGAYALGIIPEEMVVNGAVLPNKPITCEEMLAIATLACNKMAGLAEYYTSLDSFAHKEQISEQYVKYIQNAVALKLPGGVIAQNGGMIPAADATRAQAAVIAKRVYIKTY